ncbi:MAG: hypothetical protein LBC92_05495 [Rickettsiales bacterium]|nr:hypothetical protein [Rickettsiales bacterium]
MFKKKILICIKTYPNLSDKNGEVVCTAGIDEDGNFIRIYPIPYSKLDDFQKYKKYQYIEVEVNKSDISKDRRKESYNCNSETITLGEKIGAECNWQKRKDIIFRKQEIYNNMNDIIKLNKRHEISL